MNKSKLIPILMMMAMLLFAFQYYRYKRYNRLVDFNPDKHFQKSQKERYFNFYYNDDSVAIKEYAAYGESFIDLIDRDFFRVELSKPFDFYILKDQETYEAFIIDTLGRLPKDKGMYFFVKNAFVTYQGAGYGILGHIFMFPLMQTQPNFKEAPLWFKQGMTTFFEMTYSYWDGDRLIINVGYHNPKRIEALVAKGQINYLKAADVVRMTPERLDKDAVNLFMVFLYRRGKFKNYIDALIQADKKDYPTYIEAAFDNDINEIELYWKHHIAELQRNFSVARENPESCIFAAREFFNLMSANLY